MPPSPPAVRGPRLIALALLLSLAGNAAAIGAALTFWLSTPDAPRTAISRPSGGSGGRMPLGPQLKAVLPDQADAAVDAALAPHRPTLRTQARALRAARHAVAEALRAAPFDPASLSAALTTLRAREAALAGTAHAGFLAVAAGLDNDSRQAVADLVDSRRPGRKSRQATP